ncbi:hypothetical protein C2E20_9056 [Micractinium conductrix]|uniref:Uncharacterized protein n=1 Tax=Micractinium conductrix TaxID=554055 RepID=A0A2P6UZJ1_9CHLO|nr:hypothetical protein C2E20_9056 [Micractinium conductrix]|eukprot:PSC67249.1 hypothetical protein C2E20_9056 [Micractinium conductrix]
MWAAQPLPRRQRDPSTYRSMDELRQELEGEGSKGWVTGAIDWLSAAANAAASAASLQAAYQALLRIGPQPSSSFSSSSMEQDDGSDLDSEAVQQLSAVLLSSRALTVRLVRKCPRLLEMERGDLILRLVGMKDLFPLSDVARMVELAPGPFLEGAWHPKAEQLAAAAALLRAELAGAEVDFMFQEDPAILFEPLDSLETGLRRMRELWPGLTPAALADSEPLHLSLAVKALGLNGPPKGF